MRKLKLQMHVSIDGMVNARGPDRFNWDDEVRQYSIENASNVDCLLIGRKIASDFIRHWKSVADDPGDPDHKLGALITEIPKVVFSRTLDQKPEGMHATLVNGDLVQRVNSLKSQPGKDLLVYGGQGFAASLIQCDLVDEFHLLVNPVVVGAGLTIFGGLEKAIRLALKKTRAFSCGTVLLHYETSRD